MSSSVPEGWVRIDLEEGVSALISGQSPNRKENRATGDAFGILKTTAIDWGRFDEKQNQEVLDDYEPNNKHLVLENDILITKAGPTHRVGVVAQARNLRSNVLLSGKMTALRVNDRFTPDFLTYALCQEEAQNHLKANITGMASSQTNFTHDSLLRVPILSPPLPEQKKIASILTSVDEVIENTQKQIDKLQDLKKATMNELLTKGIGHTEFKDSELGRIPKSWEVENLSNFIRKITSGWSPVCNPEPRVNKEWAVLKTTAVVWSGYDPSENKVLPDKFAPKKTATVGDNELLITRKGPRERVGVCVSTGRTPINLMIPDTVFKLSLKETLSPTFAVLMLGTHIIQRDWDRKKIGLAEAQVNINHGIINETKIPLPSEQERQKICQFVNRFDLRLNALRTKRYKIQSLKKSLMQDLLTGKVRVSVN
ncbi:restriction endonuclease subunit S [Luminiphilus sp.]|nr:restriction endonuclease subunit S [Luminiphilus sp.]MDA9681563.1 restriction endonuclease subunit S [Luminiphilus sp.]